VSGMSYLENQSEIRAPTADVAAHLLDAAIASRTEPGQSVLSHSYADFSLYWVQEKLSAL